MKSGSIILRGGLVASFALVLSACGGLQQFGGMGCRTGYALIGGVVQPVNSCGGLPRDALMAQTTAPVGGNDLPALLAAPKFEPDAFYKGVVTPADKTPLTTIVNDAVRDLIAMPQPRDPAGVRRRLAGAVQAVGQFAAPDSKHAHVYLILAWRAAGFTGESGLFPSGDEQVLAVP